MTKARKVFIIISIILGVVALAGFIMVAVGVSYSFSTVSFIGFLLALPFLILLAGVWISYARV